MSQEGICLVLKGIDECSEASPLVFNDLGLINRKFRSVCTKLVFDS